MQKNFLNRHLLVLQNYKEYLLKFYEIIGKYKSNNTIDQNKCLKNRKFICIYLSFRKLFNS